MNYTQHQVLKIKKTQQTSFFAAETVTTSRYSSFHITKGNPFKQLNTYT